MPVEPDELGILHHVGDRIEIGLIMLRREDPAHVGVPEAALSRRVDIERRIGVFVVMPMLGSPPQNSALCRALGQKREQELTDTTRPIRSMRELTMISSRHAEHPHDIQRDTHRECGDRDA